MAVSAMVCSVYFFEKIFGFAAPVMPNFQSNTKTMLSNQA